MDQRVSILHFAEKCFQRALTHSKTTYFSTTPYSPGLNPNDFRLFPKMQFTPRQTPTNIQDHVGICGGVLTVRHDRHTSPTFQGGYPEENNTHLNVKDLMSEKKKKKRKHLICLVTPAAATNSGPESFLAELITALSSEGVRRQGQVDDLRVSNPEFDSGLTFDHPRDHQTPWRLRCVSFKK